MSKKIFKYRQHPTIMTTSGVIYSCEGPWHYVYVDEEIAAERSVSSIQTYTSFEDIHNESDAWPDCRPGFTAFRKRPYINIWDTWGGTRYYEKHIKEATWFSEYQEASNTLSIKQLAEELPAKHFIEFCIDNGVSITLKGD